MRAGTFLAHAFRAGKNYTVTCLRCSQVIGTFNPDGLSRAIMSNAHRGGVMCVECRALACKACGIELTQRERSEGEVCFYCSQERVPMVAVVEYADAACLASHISNFEAGNKDGLVGPVVKRMANGAEQKNGKR